MVWSTTTDEHDDDEDNDAIGDDDDNGDANSDDDGDVIGPGDAIGLIPEMMRLKIDITTPRCLVQDGGAASEIQLVFRRPHCVCPNQP